MNEKEKNAIENIKALKILFEIDDKKDFEATPSVQKDIAKDLKTLLNLIKQLQKENKKLREYYEEQNEVNAKFIAVQKVKDKIEELNKLLADIDYKDIEDKHEREFYKKEYYQVVAQIIVLKGLLEGRE